MKIPLSSRLLACCNYVNRGDRVADVGCDHGYLGIYLLTNGIAASVIESDINEGPLLAATRNARKFGTEKKMSFYLSDGVRNIPRDFDTLVCAGMGADTIISILDAAPWLRNANYRLILQCQSKRPELRKWLSATGYRIRRETLAKDGKFVYSIMEVVWEPGQSLTEAECYLSPALLADNHPLLPEYTARVLQGLELTARGLAHTGDEKCEDYRQLIAQIQNMK